jgi:quinol-cytochrome oxidoreductase complex cytochrome b subunit
MQELQAQMQEYLGSLEMDKILQLAALFFALVVLLSLVNAFFTAGAIGMARQALEKGKSDTGTMWSAGKRYFFNMFLATMLMGLLTLAGLIFLLPALAQAASLQADPQAMTAVVGCSCSSYILACL